MIDPAPVRSNRSLHARLSRVLIVIAGLAAFASPLAAQSLLYVAHNGKLALVRRAVGNMPYVLDEHKWTQVTEAKFVLQPTPEYLPVFVSVKNLNMHRTSMNLVGSGTAVNDRSLNREFIFTADIESPFSLGDVFIMVEMESKAAGGVLFLHGVGNIDAHRATHVLVDEPVETDMGDDVKTRLHIFVGGLEAFNSTIPVDRQEAVLNRMVAKRIATVQDQEVKPFVGPAPIYPTSLLKSKVKGQATVSFRVGLRGNVLDPTVASATDPAFGAAALDAIRLWRFLPRVKGNVPVETAAQMPFQFSPPS